MAQEIGIIRNARRKATDADACQMYHACRAISRVRDTVILIHGARGCAQTLSLFTKLFDGFKMQGEALEYPTRVQCSNLDENDVVFGGADYLRRAYWMLSAGTILLDPNWKNRIAVESRGVL